MNAKRATLILLAEDFISYILKYQGIDWTPPERDFPIFLRKFRPELAMAAIYFAKMHKEEFEELLSTQEPIMASREAFLRHVYSFADQNFKGNVLLMEFITFCAFAANLVSIAYNMDKEDFVTCMTEAMADIFEAKMEPHFHILGGWSSLYAMAQQYVVFIRTSPEKQNSNEDKSSEENSGT